jgi:hypothetical protein
MAENDEGIFQEAILSVFKKRKTAFLTTETLLKEVRLQKAIFPKEDKDRLDSILESMRKQDLVLTNQPKFVALTPMGKIEMEKLTLERVLEIEKAMEDRLK